jgi:4,5-DOPA dioxygenase extradiol
MSDFAQPSLPSLFVPHGAPTIALDPGAAGAALAAYPVGLPRPRAIVVISAHWHTERPTVGVAARFDTIHDFWGFPEALYSLRYPATGCPEAAKEVTRALTEAGFAVDADGKRGLDHGAWIPLRLMFPDADVPVIPLSLQGHLGTRHHLRLGEALAPLARQGFLILASGNLTHNLRDFQTAVASGGQVPAYVREFADWVWRRIGDDDIEALLDYRIQAPGAARAHPTEDHLLPLFVALGAGGDKARAERFHAGIDSHVLAMDAFAFHPGERS